MRDDGTGLTPGKARLVASAIALAAGLATPAFGQDDQRRSVEITISDGAVSGEGVERSGGLGVARVKQGQIVKLRWQSETATEIRLHGYNIETEIEPGSAATMSFEAEYAGRFAIELHGGAHNDETVLYLEVLPN